MIDTYPRPFNDGKTDLAPGMAFCHGCKFGFTWGRLNSYAMIVPHNGMTACRTFHFCFECYTAVDLHGFYHGRHQD
jgi:hypothetical protein